jgi:prophage regulatory protein
MIQITLLRRQAVETATGKSRTTIYRDIKNGVFVKPINIGGDRVAWPNTEVESIIRARIAGKTDEEIKKLVEVLHKARMTGQ